MKINVVARTKLGVYRYHKPRESLDGAGETGSHSRARGGGHVSTTSGSGRDKIAIMQKLRGQSTIIQKFKGQIVIMQKFRGQIAIMQKSRGQIAIMQKFRGQNTIMKN